MFVAEGTACAKTLGHRGAMGADTHPCRLGSATPADDLAVPAEPASVPGVASPPSTAKGIGGLATATVARGPGPGPARVQAHGPHASSHLQSSVQGSSPAWLHLTGGFDLVLLPLEPVSHLTVRRGDVRAEEGSFLLWPHCPHLGVTRSHRSPGVGWGWGSGWATAADAPPPPTPASGTLKHSFPALN